MPILYIFAGVNGARKSTLTQSQFNKVIPYEINADEINADEMVGIGKIYVYFMQVYHQPNWQLSVLKFEQQTVVTVLEKK